MPDYGCFYQVLRKIQLENAQKITLPHFFLLIFYADLTNHYFSDDKFGVISRPVLIIAVPFVTESAMFFAKVTA